MKITVTQEDIDNGLRYDTSRCMAALAIGRAFPQATRLSVGFCTADVDGDFYHLSSPAPSFIKQWVEEDDDSPVEPFEFEMERM